MNTENFYQAASARTESPIDELWLTSREGRMLHAAMGLVTEAGEILDALKKALFYGRAIDERNLIEELGDIEWYAALLRRVLNVSQETIQQTNIEKLRVRYPEQFEDVVTRDTAAELAPIDNHLEKARR